MYMPKKMAGYQLSQLHGDYHRQQEAMTNVWHLTLVEILLQVNSRLKTTVQK